jgi:RNA polymerase sigma factor (sigma-70 family)
MRTRVADDLVTLFGAGAIGRLSDAELLARYVHRHDPASSEAAFSALVSRHGPMVLGVCRRMLRDDHDAADAFQAVFLVLARKAPSVRVDDSLGRWLHGVSVRVARRASAAMRAERVRTQALDQLDPPDESAESDHWCGFDLGAAIDEEIARLPGRYRSAVVLCYLEGLTQEQAARRLRCPVGTIQSRLHRARERLRPALARRGLAPAAWSAATLARPDVPPALAAATAAGVRLTGHATAGMVPAAVARLATSTIRRMAMIQGLQMCAATLVLALAATGAANLAAGGESPAASPAPPAARTARPDAPAVRPAPSMAERLRAILAEYQARLDDLDRALEKAASPREQNAAYTNMSPDDVAFSRRMVDLAETSPADPAARDALVWVINKPGRFDTGPYGDEFARAAALLVCHHGDDPEAIRVGLELSNITSPHRDVLLAGFLASARGRESRGLARLALAQYLEQKARMAAFVRKQTGRRKMVYGGFLGDDGKLFDKEIQQSDEEYACDVLLRQCDPDGLRAEAERLYEEVIAGYADVPLITAQLRRLEALLRQPSATWNGKPITAEDRRRGEEMLARKQTLGQAAEARLDDMRNLVVGKPAPEIDGMGLDGKPLKLSDFRGKVVALAFWGTWCGPCMREIPGERELVERLKGKPFAMLGVNCDGDRPAALKAIHDERITWPNWHDGEPGTGPIVRRYHVASYPTVFVIDAKGIIRSKNAVGRFLGQSVDDLLEGLEAR